MIVGPTITLEDRRMDEANTVQQAPGQMIDTGPLPLEVLQARMTLLERELMDRMDQLRLQLTAGALEASPRRLAQMADQLQAVEQRLEMVRQLRGEW